MIYTGFGAFVIISTICTMYAMSNVQGPYKTDYKDLLPLYESVLVFAMLFLTYPIWPERFKKDSVIHVVWTIGVFYILIFCSGFLVLLSHFDHLQLIVFTVSIIIAAVLIRWQSAIYIGAIGLYLSTQAYKYFAQTSDLGINVQSSSFIFYSILLSGAAIIAFLKPKQEDSELAWEKVDHLMSRINDYRDELYKATELKYEFLRNLQHEARTPITGITTMAQAIDDSYDKIPEAKRRQAIHDMAMNAERLESYVNNLIDLSKLSSMKYDLDIKAINISNLALQRLERCQKFYISEKHSDDREFTIEIEPDITINCDEYYTNRTI